MIFKQLDYLSPSVTFYHKGFLSHSSILSGILSIISFIIIIVFSIYFSLDIIKRQNPTAFYFNRFVEDADIIPLNSSSLFHFISLSLYNGIGGDNGVDFRSFRIIGLDTYYQNYSKNKNLSNYNHWLYGLCNNESDTNGISHLINVDFFNKSACIKKYFNSTEQKYYNTNDPKFIWPIIAHGTFNSNNSFYSIILERCEEETVNLIMDKDTHCRSEDEINAIIGFNSAAHLFLIDNYIDVLNYSNPKRKFFYRIENTIQRGNYPINHLNFNPSLIKTHNGLILDKVKDEKSYSYEKNEVYTFNDKNETYTVYYFWLNNRMYYYERTYKRIQDIISNIGGIYQFITFVAMFINKTYNNYIILSDTENLLSSSIYLERKIHLKKTIIRKSSKKMKNKENKEISSRVRYNSEISRNKIDEKKRGKDVSKSKEDFITDFEINNKLELEKNNYQKNIKEDNNISNKYKKRDKSFWNYIIYRLSCEKKHNSFTIYHNFRIKIISEEHLIRNHLNIYNLLRANERKINSKKRYSYQLKDLINLV